MKKLTLEEFVNRSNKLHNNKYDYSASVYTGLHLYITIKCPEHGEFTQTAESHMRGGHGCSHCSGNTKSSTEDFINKSKIKHNDIYDYSLVEYINSSTKVNIICKKHGEFLQAPTSHIGGKGCFKCAHELIGLKSRKYHEEYISLAIEKHNNKYDYSLISDKSRPKDKVDIICPTHGKFIQTWQNHIYGKGCIKCAGVEKSTLINFVTEANTLYFNRYDYSKSQYIDANTSTVIICPDHGEFTQTPYNHLRLKGCTKCSANSSRIENEWLDTLNIPNEYRQHKITINKKKIIVDAYNPLTNTVYEFWGDLWHGNPKLYKSADINGKNKKSFGELYKETQQKRQSIISAGYKLCDIWESDFNIEKYKIKFNKLIGELIMKMSPENIIRLKQLIADGQQVLREVEDLKCGLNETIKAIGEEMEVKPAIISKLIKDIHKNKINDKRDDHEVWEELYKAVGH